MAAHSLHIFIDLSRFSSDARARIGIFLTSCLFNPFSWKWQDSLDSTDDNRNNIRKGRGEERGKEEILPLCTNLPFVRSISKMLPSNFKFFERLLQVSQDGRTNLSAQFSDYLFYRPRRRRFLIPPRTRQSSFESSVFIFGGEEG